MSNAEPKARTLRRFMRSHAAGRRGVRVNDRNPVGRIPEHPFGQDAAVKAALGRKMTLGTFGPRLDGVGNMVAQQAHPGIIGQIAGGLLGLARGVDSAQGVERRPVPEGLVARPGQQAVFGPQFRRKERLDGRLLPFVDADGQRNADPRRRSLPV